MSILYFSYGSNLHPLRIGERVATARLQGLGCLPDHRLVFHKRGQDGSGKCGLEASANGIDGVWGALYRLSCADVLCLDRYEGDGYRHYKVVIETATGALPAYTYLATSAYREVGLAPFHWYRQLVYWGAAYHGFPDVYLARIKGMPCQHDPDAARVARQQALVTRMREGRHPRVEVFL